MSVLYILFVFVFGTIIGSFLNALVFRYGGGMSISSRSICTSCGHTLRAHDLIPIASFVFLLGRCRYCSSSISLRYPLIELLVGILFVLTYWVFSFSFLTFFWWIQIALLVAIFSYDMRHMIIPDGMVYTFDFFALLYLFIDFNTFNITFITPSILSLSAGVLVAIPFALLWLFSKGRWMGLGDAKLSLGIGWLLGISLGFSAVTLGFWIGALVSLSLIFLNRFRRLNIPTKHLTIHSEIPLAPFLILGFLIVLFTNINLFTI